MIGIISGTGFAGFAVDSTLAPIVTRCGEPSATPQQVELANQTCVWLPRHGVDGSIAPHRINNRANLLALQQAGVTHLIALNSVGALRLDWPPKSLLVPDQLMDYTWGRAQSFFDGEIEPLAHIDFTEPFDTQVRQSLIRACEREGLVCQEQGVYACVQGPRLETAAEVRRLIRDGADVVGMTLMPEAALARELSIPYASICLVVNAAAGLTKESLSEAQIRATAARGMSDVERVVTAAVGETPRD